MGYSKEDLIQAAEYVVRSPFVEKVKGTSEEANLSVAKSIYESAAILGTKRKEHERALDIFTAATEDPKPCEQVLEEYVQKETEVLEADFNAKKEKWDAEPKVDEEYVASCQKEIKKLKEDVEKFKKDKFKETEGKVADFKAANQKGYKQLCILAVAMFGISMVFLMNEGASIGEAIKFSAVTIGGIALFLGLPLGLYGIHSGKKQVQAIRTQGRQAADDSIKTQMEVVEWEIESLEEKIKKGYDEKSNFYRNLHKKELEWKIFGLELAERQIELNEIKKIATDFQSAVNHVKNALDNFDALSNWAANFVRDQAQKEHNEEMEALERRRLYEQRKAAETQEEAAREQAALLKKQADAARDQAAAAQAQAEAAKKQARDTEEIRRRMERSQ